MTVKKLLTLILALALALSLCAPALAEEDAPVRVASMMGPTSMGLVKLMNDSETGVSALKYDFTLVGTANEIVPLLTRGELDIAMVPCNLASIVYNNTGAIQVAAVNTLGVLYIVENGESVNAVSDLKGKLLYSTGKGTTPEFALNYILSQNGLDPAKDLTIEYKSEAAEVLAALANDGAALGVLPQPYATAALAQNEKLRVALDLTKEWDAVSEESRMITGVCVVRSDFVKQNPEAVQTFLSEYEASVKYVADEPAQAAQWIADKGIVAKAAIAEKALPACNIVCLTGPEMKTAVSGYLTVLEAQNPEAVGGAVPDDAFYYAAP